MANLGPGDMNSCIVESYDASAHSLKTTIVNASVSVTVSAITDSIAIADVSGNKVTTTLVGSKQSLDVNVTSIIIDKSIDSIAIEGFEQASVIDEVSTSLTYFGFAAIGSATSAAVWKIKRITVTGTVTKLDYASGNSNYSKIWDNRAALSYS